MKFFVVPDSSDRCTDGDRRRRERRARVVGLDRRVVPGGDLAVHDLGERRGRQLQVRHARQVVDHGDRGDVDRQVDRGAGGAPGVGLGDLVGAQRGVRAREVGRRGDELGAAAAGPDRVVVDGDCGVGVLEALAPGVHRLLLRGRAGADELAAQCHRAARRGRSGVRGAGAGAGGAGVVVRTARCEGQRETTHERGGRSQPAVSVERHCVPSCRDLPRRMPGAVPDARDTR